MPGLASWGSRLGAYVVDWLIQAVVFAILVGPGLAITISNISNIESFGSTVTANDVDPLGIGLLLLGGLLYFVFWVLYAGFFMRRRGHHNGQTPGKQVVGIRVRRDDGQPMGFGWSLLREIAVKGLLVGMISGVANLLTFFLLGIGSLVVLAVWYLWPLWDESDRAPHDMIVSTHVVRA